MNTKVKAIIFIGSGLVAGFGAGYVIGRRNAYVKAGKQIDAWTEEQGKAIEEYKDSIARENKTGKYSTIEGASEAIFQGGGVDVNADDLADSGRHAALIDLTNGSTDPEYADGIIARDVPEGQPEDDGSSISNLIAKFKDQPISDLQSGGVTYPGQDDEPAEISDESDDDTPIPTVPGFVTVRDQERPYLISIDEYMEDTEAFAKVEMTYFEGDGVLVDNNNAIVGSQSAAPEKIDQVVGQHNLDKWGQGTTDPEQVYIRNERLEIDIELTHDDNTYTRSVLNIIPSDEEERSMRKPLKMREDDGS